MAPPKTAKKISVRGLDLYTEWHGPREGRPFVLVHGFTGSSDDFREHLPALAELGPAIAVDLRGHGESSNVGDEKAYTLEYAADDLDAALRALGITSCDLLGHSMGGMIALRFALEHPDRIDSLVLMDTAAGPVSLVPPELLERAVEFVRSGGSEALVASMERRPRPPSPAERAYEERVGTDVARERVLAKLRLMDPAAFCGFMRVLADQPSVEDRLPEITCPTLVLVGDEDAPFLEPSEVMRAGIPGATKIVIPNAAHSPQLENPDAWRAAITGHLQRART